ncbi:MAG: hypothetical protein BM557_02385 [Flavobacterium sp. MedPE-SWcel]|uniref:porin family protein n=1 Tax=uncultured Flavobacterium sp. TaxID=165435 RepID=UPI00091828E2|nr:porin family protein [uncultured Flavobacterium sp.]OIQ21665.1 MAG: hypothetical protein BM557_02385 [Flavobacterium sp. MedPE-SWcel]
MRLLFLFTLSFIISTSFAQDLKSNELEQVQKDSVTTVVYSKYREDQFYASVSYVLMQGKPSGYSQNSFSTGLSVGFLRDMPINKNRTYAIAAGLGYSYYNIKHNLKVSENAGTKIYEQVSTLDFDKNKLVLHYLELPIEFRWRNSTAESHKFWRIYTGFKVSYLLRNKAQFYALDGADIRVTNNRGLNKLVYGAYVAAGWNTWNLYVYYGLTPIYEKEARLSGGQEINLNAVNFGVMFYIL